MGSIQPTVEHIENGRVRKSEISPSARPNRLGRFRPPGSLPGPGIPARQKWAGVRGSPLLLESFRVAGLLGKGENRGIRKFPSEIRILKICRLSPPPRDLRLDTPGPGSRFP